MFLKMEISRWRRQSRWYAYKGGSRCIAKTCFESSGCLSSMELIWMNYESLDPLGRGHVGSRNDAAQSLKLKSCVDFVKLVCRFCRDWWSRDLVSISPRSCVDFDRCSLELSSYLKKFHRVGECREGKNRKHRVFKLYDRTSVDWAVDRHAQGLIGRPILHKEQKPSWVGWPTFPVSPVMPEDFARLADRSTAHLGRSTGGRPTVGSILCLDLTWSNFEGILLLPINRESNPLLGLSIFWVCSWENKL